MEEASSDEKSWAKMALLNTANSGKFTSDRTIQEYVDDMFRDLYDSLLNTKNTDRPDRYFILADFRAYAEAQ